MEYIVVKSLFFLPQQEYVKFCVFLPPTPPLKDIAIIVRLARLYIYAFEV